MKKVGVVTLYRGYNYGTSLQAYALRNVIQELGYDAEIVWTSENAHAGRDIRVGKIARMTFRMIVHPELGKRTVAAYRKSIGMPIDPRIKRRFVDFERTELKVKGLSKRELNEYARNSKTQAVVCGSDQIWSAAGANVEPLYYLRFVPPHKRIAYAPSFGTSCVPDYNRKIIKKYISDFPSISVREPEGAVIIGELIGREVSVVLDPTFLLQWNQWEMDKQEEYILVYFLNEPSGSVIKEISKLQERENCKVYALPYQFDAYKEIANIEYVVAGPKEFTGLIRNAKCVLTDSFHGTAFSINFNVPFWTFARNYGTAVVEQSSRITSILKLFGLEVQYVSGVLPEVLDIPKINFKDVNMVLNEQRERSKKYLKDALDNVQ